MNSRLEPPKYRDVLMYARHGFHSFPKCVSPFLTGRYFSVLEKILFPGNAGLSRVRARVTRAGPGGGVFEF